MCHDKEKFLTNNCLIRLPTLFFVQGLFGGGVAGEDLRWRRGVRAARSPAPPPARRAPAEQLGRLRRIPSAQCHRLGEEKKK